MRKIVLVLTLLWTFAFTQTAKQDCEECTSTLPGDIFSEIDKDYVNAAKFYEKCCDCNQYDACQKLGILYGDGKGVEKNSKKGFELIKKSCDGGSVRGCTSLAYQYHLGGNVKQDHKKALELFKKACEGNYGLSCYMSATYYTGEYEENGIEKDDKNVIGFYTKACDKGLALGCTILGGIYHSGDFGTEKDNKKASYFYKKACNGADDQWSACAAYAAYAEDKDKLEAARYYKKACELGKADPLAKNEKSAQVVQFACRSYNSIKSLIE